MSALSYMQRRVSGIYEFRKRLPDALAGKPVPSHMRERFADLINHKTGRFKRELVRSLKTSNVKEAKRRNHQEAHRVAILFEEAELAVNGSASPARITETDLAEIKREVIAELLQADEAEREDGDDRRVFHTSEDRQKWPDLVPGIPLAPNEKPPQFPAPHVKGMAKDHYLVYGDSLAELDGEFREAYSRRDPSIVDPETRGVLRRWGLPLDRSAPHYRQVGMAVLEGTVQAYELMCRRQVGEIIKLPQADVVRSAQNQTSAMSVSADRGPRLSEAFEAWKAGGIAKGAKKPNANTVVEAEQAVRYFLEFHGDMRLGDITREKARQYRDAVAQIPRNLPTKLRRLRLPELLQRDLSQYQQRNATTVHKLLALLGAIISLAEREGRLDRVQGFVNPFGKGLRFAVQPRDSERTLFDRSDLMALFSSPVFSGSSRPLGGGGEAAIWFPLIGLFSGMRLDEIAQLRICDLRQDEETGRWFFDIDRTGGRSTKTLSSVRQVPVHRELERIGLVRYRQALIEAGGEPEGPLWPDIKANGDRPRSSAWSKWFGRYVREKCGITDANKVFHSFRHTFKRMTRDAGLPEEMHDALTGHASRGGVGRRYGRGYSIKPLVEAMDKVVAPIDLRGLRWR